MWKFPTEHDGSGLVPSQKMNSFSSKMNTIVFSGNFQLYEPLLRRHTHVRNWLLTVEIAVIIQLKFWKSFTINSSQRSNNCKMPDETPIFNSRLYSEQVFFSSFPEINYLCNGRQKGRPRQRPDPERVPILSVLWDGNYGA